ncbi:MAG: ankyrin repeat domain-containing protein [bacterium]
MKVFLFLFLLFVILFNYAFPMKKNKSRELFFKSRELFFKRDVFFCKNLCFWPNEVSLDGIDEFFEELRPKLDAIYTQKRTIQKERHPLNKIGTSGGISAVHWLILNYNPMEFGYRLYFPKEGKTKYLKDKSPYLELLKLFFMYGADRNIQDFQGNTPLHYAVFYALKYLNLDLVRFLVSRNVLIDIKNNMKKTPIDLVLEFQKVNKKFKYKLIDIILENWQEGLDLDLPEYFILLQDAIKGGYVFIVRFLVEALHVDLIDVNLDLILELCEKYKALKLKINSKIEKYFNILKFEYIDFYREKLESYKKKLERCEEKYVSFVSIYTFLIKKIKKFEDSDSFSESY